MADILIVKTEYNGDIRRFAVPHSSYNVKYIRTTASLLYQLSPENVAMWGVVNTSEIPISTDEDLHNSVQLTPSSGNIVRLIIQNIPSKSSKEVEEDEDETTFDSTKEEVPQHKVTELSDEMVDKLMDHPKVKSKIQEMVISTLGDKKTISKLSKKLNKRKKSKRASQIEEVAPESEPTIEEPSSLSSSDNVESQPEVSPPVEQESEESSKEEEVVEDQKSEVEVGQFVVLENVEPPKRELKFSEAIEAKLEALSSSPIIQSFLALFKPKPKQNNSDESANNSDSESVPKTEEETAEVPEETLKQLQDMGFDDREANLKTLKFHKKYNEGLDAVVEDLLQQKNSENKN